MIQRAESIVVERDAELSTYVFGVTKNRRAEAEKECRSQRQTEPANRCP